MTFTRGYEVYDNNHVAVNRGKGVYNNIGMDPTSLVGSKRVFPVFPVILSLWHDFNLGGTLGKPSAHSQQGAGRSFWYHYPLAKAESDRSTFCQKYGPECDRARDGSSMVGGDCRRPFCYSHRCDPGAGLTFIKSIVSFLCNCEEQV